MDDIKNNGNSDSYSKLYDLKKQLLEEKQKTADMQAQLAAYQETYRQMVGSTKLASYPAPCASLWKR
jgi:hypothetical protein